MITRRSFAASCLVTLALPAGLGAAAPGGRDLHALLIGVAGYRRLTRLGRSTADARSLTDRLGTMGFRTTSLIDPTFAQLNAGIADFARGLGPESLSLVFYAGHGFQIAGTNYITAVDTARTADDLLATVVPASRMLADIAARRPRHSIVILDACRTNPLPPSLIGNNAGFASIAAPEGFYIVFSAGSGETALDDLGPDDRDSHGVFTRALLANLNMRESFDRIIKKTRVSVADMAETIDHSQHPAIYDQTKFEFRLDGSMPDQSLALLPPKAGRMPSTAVLIFAVKEQAGSQFHGSVDDAVYMSKVFKGLGATVVERIGVTLQQARDSLSAVARGDHDTVIILFFGPAGYFSRGDNAEGVWVFSDDPDYTDAGAINFVMPLWDAALRVRKPGRTSFIFSDMARVISGNSTRFFGGDKHSVMDVLQGGPERDPDEDRHIGSIGLLFSATYGQNFPDVQRPHGAFPLALANALARPGLTFRELSQLVARDVQQITDDRQSPLMVATKSAKTKILVSPA